ncbi:MAG TPA: LacI family DNA-binding transcriptional regulator [Bacillus sp. (in: firmicutes)]|nr:LacI family DNA-binding transcriptional regulator [Bacillus sp. (in: firmicutes)]
MSVTIKDVARKANVSVATVSRVLNNLPGYSEETKKRVMNTIEQMGYQPNAIARGLINKQTKTIGVLLPAVSDLFAAAILNGVEDRAYELDYSVIICKTDKNGARTMRYLQMLREKQVDGIVFVSDWMTDAYYRTIKGMELPVVLVSSQSAYPLPYVKVNDYKASYDAVSYLIQHGHTYIGMIAGTKEDPLTTVPRVRAFKQALQDHQLYIDECSIVYGDFGFPSGIEGMKKLLLHYPYALTAVFCASDEMAAGALSFLHKQNMKVPNDISVIGYDNTATAEKTVPPLTTVGQPLYEMGRISVEILLGHHTEKEVIVPHSIIERDTVSLI